MRWRNFKPKLLKLRSAVFTFHHASGVFRTLWIIPRAYTSTPKDYYSPFVLVIIKTIHSLAEIPFSIYKATYIGNTISFKLDYFICFFKILQPFKKKKGKRFLLTISLVGMAKYMFIYWYNTQAQVLFILATSPQMNLKWIKFRSPKVVFF